MIVYKVAELYEDVTEWQYFGTYLTRDMAESVIKMFEGYDGFGVCEEVIKIQEINVSDEIPDNVLKLLEACKQSKKEYEEES